MCHLSPVMCARVCSCVCVCVCACSAPFHIVPVSKDDGFLPGIHTISGYEVMLAYHPEAMELSRDLLTRPIRVIQICVSDNAVSDKVVGVGQVGAACMHCRTTHMHTSRELISTQVCAVCIPCVTCTLHGTCKHPYRENIYIHIQSTHSLHASMLISLSCLYVPCRPAWFMITVTSWLCASLERRVSTGAMVAKTA